MIQKIVIINGNPLSGENNLNNFIQEINEKLSGKGFEIESFSLSGKNIKQCVGCFDCWWKTPGLCRFNDDSREILKSVINSNMVIYASPMIMGMYSALLKKFHDRTIPLVHPYIKMKGGECHHLKRYPKYPEMGILIEPNDATPEEIELTKRIFHRIKLNFHSEVRFFYSIYNILPKKLADEISHI